MIVKFRTTSTGCQVESVSGDTHLIVRAEGDDASTDAILRLSVNNTSATSILQFGDNDSSSVGMVLYEHLDDSMRFRTNGSEHWRITSAGHLENNNDTGRIKLGTSDDLQIYHDGTNSYLDNATGIAFLRNTGTNGSQIQLLNNNSGLKIQGKIGEQSITVLPNGAVELYYDNSGPKLATTATGVNLGGGTCTFNNNGKLALGLIQTSKFITMVQTAT